MSRSYSPRPSLPSSSSGAGSPPDLTALARLLHHGLGEAPTPLLVHVATEPGDTVTIGSWPLPPSHAHPVDALVGFRAPDAWDGLGIRAGATSRTLPDLGGPHDAAVTVLAGRDGQVATVLDQPDGPPMVIGEPPVGWVPDVIARCLGLPTPPPEQTTAALVETVWVDRLAAGLLGAPHLARSWRWMTDRHPLRGTGSVPGPDELAARTARHAIDHPWAAVRCVPDVGPLPAALHGPPCGQVLGTAAWFDDGSLARWMLRWLPPADQVLPDLMSMLPDHLGASLAMAMVTVEPG